MQAPKISSQEINAILKKINQMVPFYTPEWSFSTESQEAGAALMKIFAQMQAGTANRLNQVPDKHYAAFLNMLGAKLLPAQPARAPMTFVLSAGAREAVLVPAGAQITAKAADGGKPVIFQTEKQFLASPAEIKAILSTIPAQDSIFEHSSMFENGKPLQVFNQTEEENQEHCLYLAHQDFFNLQGEADITIQITTKTGTGAAYVHDQVSWEWWNGTNWVPSNMKAYQEEGSPFPVVASLEKAMKFADDAAGMEIGVTTNAESDTRLPLQGLLLIGNHLVITKEKNQNRLFIQNMKDREASSSKAALDFSKGDLIRTVDYPLQSKYELKKEGRAEHLLVTLKKNFPAPFSMTTVNGRENMWIRCRALKNKHPKTSSLFKLAVDTINIQVSSSTPLKADALFYNDIPLSGENFYPFGRQPKTFDTFYIASRDAFSKKSGVITLYFNKTLEKTEIPVEKVQGIGAYFARQLKAQDINTLGQLLHKSPEELSQMLHVTIRQKVIPISLHRAQNILEAAAKCFYDKWDSGDSINPSVALVNNNKPDLSWEYWNGSAWVNLISSGYVIGQDAKPFAFNCPGDIAPTKVNGLENYWIRVRIADGDYGRVEYTLAPDGKTLRANMEGIRAPQINTLQLTYETGIKHPECCLSRNNLQFEDHSRDASTSPTTFSPFKLMDNFYPALYFGFTEAPLKGMISIFLSMAEKDHFTDRPSQLLWDYYGKAGGAGEWIRLAVNDNTNCLSNSGTIEFIGPADFTLHRCFGRELYWIRALDRGGSFLDNNGIPLGLLPQINSIHMNTVWASQVESLQEEHQITEINGNMGFKLNRFPVLAEDIWINEIAVLSDGERANLQAEGSYEIQERRDHEGNQIEFWIKWKPAEDLLYVSADRCYALDRALGIVSFGEENRGRLLSAGSNVKVSYQVGGGKRGNVGSGEITELLTSLAFIDRAYNPQEAGGGSDGEGTDQALEKGSQVLRNRGRAVTCQDFEWLARRASSSVIRCKCLSNTRYSGSQGQDSGWVTVVIVPESTDTKPRPSRELIKLVKDYLSQRAADVLISTNHLLIKGPDYMEISVTASLITQVLDLAPGLEVAAVEKLSAFLHPLCGGYGNRGWDFGRFAHLSDLYALLEDIPGIDYVEELSMDIKNLATGELIKLASDKLWPGNIDAGILLCSGKHQITIKGSV